MFPNFSDNFLYRDRPDNISVTTMAARDWELILNDRSPVFKLEEQGFKDSLEICNSTDVSAEKFNYTIRDSEEIPENLKAMYREAVFATHEKVRNRIKNRISNMRRNNR